MCFLSVPHKIYVLFLQVHGKVHFVSKNLQSFHKNDPLICWEGFLAFPTTGPLDDLAHLAYFSK
ncbi:MAG TPA: hypothetical protein DDY32_08610 [Desulfobulbaceae bacterium]|nr:hypothetical protein [Desulfobulbaceae bacterium]